MASEEEKEAKRFAESVLMDMDRIAMLAPDPQSADATVFMVAISVMARCCESRLSELGGGDWVDKLSEVYVLTMEAKLFARFHRN